MRQLFSPAWVLIPALAMLAACGGETTDTKNDKTDTASGDTTAGDASGVDSAGGDASGGGDATGDTGGGDSVGSDGEGDVATTDVDDGKKYKTCSPLGDCAIAACAAKGFAAGCADACLADASDGALAKGGPLLACTQKNCVPACKDSDDPDCLGDCIFEQCTGDFVACISDGATPAGAEPCITLPGCFEGCDLGKGGPFSCMSKCIEKTDQVGLDLLIKLGSCYSDAAANNKDPEETCGKEQLDCVVSGKSGDLQCFEAFGCATACEKAGGTDDECMFQCLPKLTKDAQGQFFTMLPCLGQSIDQACGAKLLACADPSGDKGCAASMACIGQCGEDAGGDDPGCMFKCIHEAKKTSGPALLGVIGACNDDKAAPPPGDATETGDSPPSPECIASLFVCAEPADTGDDCKAMTACIGACDSAGGDGFGCGLGCAAKGSKAEVKLLSDFMNCQFKCDEQCKGKGDACKGPCIQTECPAAAGACLPKS